MLREQKIISLLQKASPLTIEELASSLAVSEPTIRRDLAAMEEKGLILKQRGGAALPGLGFEPMFNQRQQHNREQKRQIAKYAASQILEGEVIALDVGTTSAELAKELLKLSNLTIFTYSLQIALILSRSQHNIYIIGGQCRKSEQSMVGSIAKDTISQFNFDRFFMGLAGFNKEQGPTDFILEEVEIKRLMIEKSKRVIALADSSKFGGSSLVKVCEYDAIDELITNQLDITAEDLDYRGKLTFV
ncbi:DeoR/GlpR transcriptional regulator [Paenibacillus sp. 19GGS1-52]|uniref:DeoR/GlpR family DNA-binding transcription regulator n=1 Tax=Paenibacillus sp. 19GGS1-52 TaxID=2758563 RepID=UPI001EFA800B|nr:DeoR/GlpR family DNA-binding transcription regulator [Paenibacillus sp. 19GGS1-52]ULO09213.1 DeoR/GlpR transcriptional regulator [Paenibacillus sp. 19GGS1-52]